MICHSTARVLWPQKFFAGICLFSLVFIPAQANESPKVFGVASERWYVQTLPDDALPQEPVSQLWDHGLYLDLGYGYSSNNPENNLWRSRDTTFKLNQPQVNLAMAYVSKQATPESRWGIEFGLQTGVDTEYLVPAAPPTFNEPISNADTLRHLYRANATYLFPLGDGLGVTAGLINSYIGYQSFLAIQNINYTRGYLLDFVPYFMFGVESDYAVSDTLDVSLFVVNGWNYLAHANDTPSLGFQSAWGISPQVRFIQSFYYGPDQEETNTEFWRFFSDSIIEWKNDRYLLAGALDFGTEKQADITGNPRYNWMSGALWFGWHIHGPWNLGLRSEFFSDPDGIATGARQNIQAFTGTVEYTVSPVASNTAVLALEYRYDQSSGEEGGFFKGDTNRLVPDQHLVIVSLMWSF